MYGLCTEGVTEEDVSASVVTETDTSLQNSTTLPTIDEDNNTTATTGQYSWHSSPTVTFVLLKFIIYCTCSTDNITGIIC